VKKVRNDYFQRMDWIYNGNPYGIESGEIKEWPDDVVDWAMWKFENVFHPGNQMFKGLTLVKES
jgi:hypothetical protein